MGKYKYIAESFGTFMLVIMGCGAIIVNDIYFGALGNIGVSLIFGLTVMSAIYILGHISGAHINPAVTIGLYFADRIPKKIIIPFVSSQIFGAIIASFVLKVLFPQHENLGATISSVSIKNTFILETFLSFFLMCIILVSSKKIFKDKNLSGVIIGTTITLEAFLFGSLTGASMNPARSIGPALVSGNFNMIWIYITAPVLGTSLASIVLRLNAAVFARSVKI